MDSVTISNIDARWSEFGFSEILESPSLLYKKITLNEGYLYEKQKKLEQLLYSPFFNSFFQHSRNTIFINCTHSVSRYF